MTLSSMVVSRDWQEISVLECILGSLHMDVTVESDPQRALTRLTRSKTDALIVDCDLNGSTEFLDKLRHADRRAPSAPLVLMGRPDSTPRLEATGALFAFEKPVSVEEAVHTLSAARNLILDGRLRYHRAGLEVPVSVNCKGCKEAAAHLVNLSEGGMRIHSDDLVEAAKPLEVSFALPGTRSYLKAQAEIAWQDQSGNMGIRFVKIPARQQRTLQLWLAQQYFTN
ncbi:MAG: PilZ domain-containing protein [Candidatus Sulfotelmatobacter sp.]